jgi:hypothetical protein
MTVKRKGIKSNSGEERNKYKKCHSSEVNLEISVGFEDLIAIVMHTNYAVVYPRS